VPRSGTPEPTNFSNPKGATLSTWINFMLCGGQQQMKQLGYSPLPENLVQGGLIQNAKIPGHVHVPSVSQLTNCQNPTMDHGKNILLSTAPFPSPCQKLGAPLNCVVKNGKAVAAGGGGNSAGPKASASASAGAGTTTTGTGTGTTTGATGPVTGVVVNLAGDHSNQAALGALTAFGIVLAVALPPGLAAWMRRRRGQARG
jgi:phosphate transport system substrate-binding protein